MTATENPNEAAGRTRLLVMIYEYPPLGGGGGVACQHIVNELAASYAYDITVITASVGDDAVQWDSPTVEVLRLRCASRRPHRSSATFLFMLTYVVRAALCAWRLRQHGRKFDLVHTHFCIPTGPAGWVAAKVFGVPNVLTLIGGDLLEQPLEQREYQNPLLRAVIRRIILAADVVTAISEDTRQAALKFVHDRKAIHVLTLGFQPPASASSQETHSEADSSHVRLIAVSRLVPRKGFDLLLETLARLRHKAWTLKIVGDGPDEQALKSLAARLGIADRLSFAGFLTEEQKYQQLRESDLFILFSHHEGLGLVFFEAMHCGLPIVTSRRGGQTDFLSEPDNVLFVDTTHTPDQLAVTVERGLNDAAWRTTAGQQNSVKIRSLYTREIVGDYDKLFQAALQELSLRA